MYGTNCGTEICRGKTFLLIYCRNCIFYVIPVTLRDYGQLLPKGSIHNNPFEFFKSENIYFTNAALSLPLSPPLSLSLSLRTIMTSSGILWFLVLSLSILATGSIRTLNTIDELADSKIEFGKKFPQHGLRLLYWLSKVVEYNLDNVPELRNINPSTGHYGFHYDSSYDAILPSNPDFRYYTFGNLNPSAHSGSRQLPWDITKYFYGIGVYTGPRSQQRLIDSNKDRIIVQLVQNTSHSVVKRVFISEQGNSHKTYQISLNLLRDINNIRSGENTFLKQARYDFRSINEVYYKIFGCNMMTLNENSWSNLCKDDSNNEVKLEVQTAVDGNAIISWSGIPQSILDRIQNRLKIYLCLRLYPNKESYTTRCHHKVTTQSGCVNTYMPVETGMKIHLEERIGFNNFRKIWGGPEFDETSGMLPAKLDGYDASLQLFLKHGKTCVRLYIHKSFTDWKNKFKDSWVQVDTYRETNWLRVTDFIRNTHQKDPENHMAYEYSTDLVIAREVRALFYLTDDFDSLIATTSRWEPQWLVQSQTCSSYNPK